MENVQLDALNAAFVAQKGTIDLTQLVRINGGISEGFIGKVTKFGYVKTTVKVTAEGGQNIEFGDQKINIPKGDMALSLSLSFEGGQTVAVRTLCASMRSKIGDEPARNFLQDTDKFFGLVGKTLSLPEGSVNVDKSLDRTEIINVAGQLTPRVRPTKFYTVVVS